MRDDKKLKHKKVIKNELLNNCDSKKLKFKISNILFVFSLWSNNGAKITADPFKKYKNSAIKNITPVTKVNGIALLINFFSPDLKELSSSKINVIECLIEWRKQK